MTMPKLPPADAWLCKLYEEDGRVSEQIVLEDPEGLRWNDMGLPSPFTAMPLIGSPAVIAYARQYAAEVAAPLVEALCNAETALELATCHSLLIDTMTQINATILEIGAALDAHRSHTIPNPVGSPTTPEDAQ